MERFTFDAVEASAGTFGDLMTNVDGFYARRAILSYRGVPLIHKVPGWFSILVNHQEGSFEAAIYAMNGYLVAIREEVEGEVPPWFYFPEFQNEVESLPGEKKKLACASGYVALLDYDWTGLAAGVPALNDSCHRILHFLRAHRDAAVPEKGIAVSQDDKRAIARLIFMLCEPPRLRSARNFVSGVMGSPWMDRAVDLKLKSKVNGWGKLSRFGLHCLFYAAKGIEDEFDPKELEMVSRFGIKVLLDCVGPNGELLLICCRDYIEEEEQLRRRRG